MELAAVSHLLLTLEEHIADFLNLAYQTNYPDTGLNEHFKHNIPNSVYGPQGRFIDFVEMVVLASGSSFTMG